MYKEFLKDAERRMDKAIQALDQDLRTLRTGRATPALLERIKIDYYGVPTPLTQVASVTVPEARMLLIKPWDPGTLSLIERAIQESDLGLNPNNDGQVIRLVLPPLTEERRRELVKAVHQRVEEARIAIRNIRRDVLHDVEQLKKEGDISEDDFFRAKDEIQELTNKKIKEAEKIGQAKEEEIMEV